MRIDRRRETKIRDYDKVFCRKVPTSGALSRKAGKNDPRTHTESPEETLVLFVVRY